MEGERVERLTLTVGICRGKFQCGGGGREQRIGSMK